MIMFTTLNVRPGSLTGTRAWADAGAWAVTLAWAVAWVGTFDRARVFAMTRARAR
jgi:hypothetical protein